MLGLHWMVLRLDTISSIARVWPIVNLRQPPRVAKVDTGLLVPVLTSFHTAIQRIFGAGMRSTWMPPLAARRKTE